MAAETLGTDFIVSDLLSELKAENARKDFQIHKLNRTLATAVIAAMATILLVIAGFLWYLNQYDFTSYETSTAEGVYALIDSEGNVITADLSPEDISQILTNGSGD